MFHAPLVTAEPQLTLSGIVTSVPERQAEARTRYPDASIVPTPGELLAQDLDLVVVASPPTSHVPLARAALDARSAVVVDKPLCASAADGEALLAHARAAGRPLTVFQNRRWDSDFLTLLRVIASGALGEIRHVESRFERWKPSPDPTKPWRRAGPQEAGGVVYDLGAHLIDQAVQLLGPVTGLHADLRSFAGTDGPDDGFLSLQHAKGAVSRLWTSTVAGQPGPRFRVLGSEGAFVSWGLDPQEAQLAAGMDPQDERFGLPDEDEWPDVGVSGATESVPPERGDYPAFYRGVADALLSGSAMPVDPEDSVEVVRLLEWAHRAD